MRILLIIFLLFNFKLNAHQPKLINYTPTLDKPHNVIYPEISKAYYSQLTGQPHYYIIKSENDSVSVVDTKKENKDKKKKAKSNKLDFELIEFKPKLIFNSILHRR